MKTNTVGLVAITLLIVLFGSGCMNNSHNVLTKHKPVKYESGEMATYKRTETHTDQNGKTNQAVILEERSGLEVLREGQSDAYRTARAFAAAKAATLRSEETVLDRDGNLLPSNTYNVGGDGSRVGTLGHNGFGGGFAANPGVSGSIINVGTLGGPLSGGGNAANPGVNSGTAVIGTLSPPQ